MTELPAIITLRMKPELQKLIRDDAERNYRTMTKQVEMILAQYYATKG